jgi:hypothetical protein
VVSFDVLYPGTRPADETCFAGEIATVSDISNAVQPPKRTRSTLDERRSSKRSRHDENSPVAGNWDALGEHLQCSSPIAEAPPVSLPSPTTKKFLVLKRDVPEESLPNVVSTPQAMFHAQTNLSIGLHFFRHGFSAGLGKGRHYGIGEWSVLSSVDFKLSHRRLIDYVGYNGFVRPNFNRSRVIRKIVVRVIFAV